MVQKAEHLRKVLSICATLVVVASLGGCNSLTAYKVTSTIFDGVPRMPPADQYCKDYHDQAMLEELTEEGRRSKEQGSSQGESAHPPYVEKRCNDCHDKNKESGFVVEADKLCVHCHTGFPSGEFVHGPVAVGACLKCHVPHSSKYPSLLVRPRTEVCSICHTEPRAAMGLHKTAISKEIACVDCHNPHAGNDRYFLR
jgi:predicted CXXCH cytochrome family protein